MVPIHLTAQKPLDAAVVDVLESPTEAGFQLLDRLIRAHLLAWLRDGVGEGGGLSQAILRASEAAPPRWSTCWDWALEVVRDASSSPGLAQQLRLLVDAQERAADVIRAIGIEEPRPRASVRAQLGMSEQHLTGVLRKLEDGRLVERARAGRESWLNLTQRGRSVYRMLRAVDRQERAVETQPERLATTAPAWLRPVPSARNIPKEARGLLAYVA